MTKLVDDFEASIGVAPFRLTNTIQTEALKYLELESHERAKLTAEECAEANLILSQYSAHIGRACQREESTLFWAESQIDKAIRGRLGQQAGYGFAEKKLMAIAENQHAQKLESIRVLAQTKWKRLSYLSQRIDKIAAAYHNLSFVKRKDVQNGY